MNTLKTEEAITRPGPGTNRVAGSEKLMPEPEKYTDRFKEVFINKVRNDVTRYIIEQYLEGITSGADPESIASLFSEDVDFYIPAHVELVPWIEHRRGRSGVIDFVNELHKKIEPIGFEVESMLVDGAEAVALGELESRGKHTGKTIKSEFAFAFTVHNALITRFRLFEDSFGVSQAAKKQKRELVSGYY